MSTDKAQQGVPIIIKGGTKKSSIPIRITAYDEFHITESIQSGSNDWIESKSDDPISYIESVVLGDNQQFCQTSTMKHPITLTFKDSDSNHLFKITEVEVSGTSNFNLSISVEYPGSFFQADGSSWSESDFDPSDMEIHLVEVTDVNNTPVCQLVREKGDDSDFILNLEPPT